jgi:ubiquinone/menaquinone biosynthesis C-methylase UbiE
MTRYHWPKTFPPLTPEQERIRDDFMKHWHEVLPKKFGIIDRFNHSYCVKHAGTFERTLEIGAGIGEHIEYEALTPEQERNYHALELRENMSREIARRFPRIRTITADCQQTLPFADGYFDRVLAIHVLEHLPNLPVAVAELYRVCDKRRGVLSVVIPCEGSVAYTLARRVSAQRIFEKRYKQPYKWFIEREHVNVPGEIFAALDPYFTVHHRSFFPFPVPLLFCNLVIGLTLQPRKESSWTKCA